MAQDLRIFIIDIGLDHVDGVFSFQIFFPEKNAQDIRKIRKILCPSSVSDFLITKLREGMELG